MTSVTPGGPGHLEAVAQQPEAGDVGRRGDPGRERGPRGLGVEPDHRRDRLREHLPRRLVPVVQHADAERLGQADRQARLRGVVAQQPGRVGDAGDGHAVLGLRVVDALPAGEVHLRLAGDVHPAAQDLGQQLHRQHVARPADEVERDERRGAHGVDVGERVRRADPAEVVRVVHHGGEEVGRRHDRAVAVDADHGRVVPGLEADEQVRRGPRDEPGDDLLELARRDLAGAPAPVGVLGQADRVVVPGRWAVAEVAVTASNVARAPRGDPRSSARSRGSQSMRTTAASSPGLEADEQVRRRPRDQRRPRPSRARPAGSCRRSRRRGRTGSAGSGGRARWRSVVAEVAVTASNVARSRGRTAATGSVAGRDQDPAASRHSYVGRGSCTTSGLSRRRGRGPDRAAGRDAAGLPGGLAACLVRAEQRDQSRHASSTRTQHEQHARRARVPPSALPPRRPGSISAGLPAAASAGP